MNLHERAARHAALGDTRRLEIVDRLAVGDLTVAELGVDTGLSGNLLAHHLDVLEEAGVIERRISEGDRRRRYVSLRWEAVPALVPASSSDPGRVAFVCTHNSARSQFAAALWSRHTGQPPVSAGSQPSESVHPKAVQVADEYGIDLSSARPAGYATLPDDLGLVVSVCDRARESGVPGAGARAHWSVRDPVAVGTIAAFRDSFAEIAERVDHLIQGSKP